MQLVACAEPEGPLEAAPATALLACDAAGATSGFWGGDDRYYARVVEPSGMVRWYTLGDGVVALGTEPVVRAGGGARRVTLVALATRTHGGALVWATGARRRG